MHVEKFRNMEDLKFSLGAKLTFIAGGNGTYKTSLLGLIGNTFIYSDKTTRRAIAKTIMGDEFRAWLRDIHHFTEHDNVEEMKHVLHLTNKFGNRELFVKGYYRREGGKPLDPDKFRFVVGKTRGAGEGHYVLPVIYLGLKRLVPIGEHNAKNVDISNVDFTGVEKTLYEEIYNYIQNRVLFKIGTNQNFVLEKVVTNNKEMLGGRNSTHDSRGFSAGQDNISQIATAITSFAKLKAEQGASYKGGILLIDEVESTLHPSALRRLLEVLYKYAGDYQLQIITTTHSLDVLKFGIESKYKNVSKIVYLTKRRGEFECLSDCSFTEIKEDMTARLENKKQIKIPVYCEDDEAKSFLNNVLESDIKNDIKIIPFDNDCGNYGFLKKVSSTVVARNSNAIFVLDGDQPLSSETDNIMVLPGGESPEAVIYHFLSRKEPGDTFFNEPNPHQEIYLGDFSFEPADRGARKAFFNNLKETLSVQTPRKIINAWKRENAEELSQFNERLRKKISKLQLNLL